MDPNCYLEHLPDCGFMHIQLVGFWDGFWYVKAYTGTLQLSQVGKGLTNFTLPYDSSF